jgi:hypothetical protein
MIAVPGKASAAVVRMASSSGSVNIRQPLSPWLSARGQ